MRTLLYRVAWLALAIILVASIFLPIFSALSVRTPAPMIVVTVTPALPILRAERMYPLARTPGRAPAIGPVFRVGGE